MDTKSRLGTQNYPLLVVIDQGGLGGSLCCERPGRYRVVHDQQRDHGDGQAQVTFIKPAILPT